MMGISPRNRARALVVVGVTTMLSLISAPSFAAVGDASDSVTTEFTALSGDVTTMGIALLALVAGGVGIGLAIHFVLKSRRAASGV